MGLGISPIASGMALDAIGSFEAHTGGVCWNRYSIYFAACAVIVLAAAAYASLLHEPHPSEPQSPASSSPVSASACARAVA